MYNLSRFDSVRSFVQGDAIYIDYRIDKERTRFSTKIKYTKTAMKSVEKNKYELANEHFEKILDNKNIVLFKDISILAIEETKCTVTTYTYKDNMKSVTAYLNPYFGDMDMTKIKAMHIDNL